MKLFAECGVYALFIKGKEEVLLTNRKKMDGR